MNNKSKLFFAFAIGAAVGAAITALMTTDKGNEMMDKVKDKTKGFMSDLEKGIHDIIDGIIEKENPKA